MNRLKAILAAVAVSFGFANVSQAQILYKVEKAGNDKVSYLLGTHHFAPLSVVDSIAELPDILNGVDKLMGEVVMADMQSPETMMKMQQVMMAPADSTLDKVLSPAQLDSVGAVWKEYTGGMIPLEAMYMMKPAIISTQLAALMAQKVLPQLNGMEGIDMVMQNRAIAAGKPVEAFETVDFQTDMLFNTPISEQAEGLMDIVGDIEGEQQRAIELATAYLNHNIDTILEQMLKADEDNPAATERMIYSRNDNWVRTMTGQMPSESMLVVVGAGHLPGPRGVIEGLRKAGYTVTAVK